MSQQGQHTKEWEASRRDYDGRWRVTEADASALIVQSTTEENARGMRVRAKATGQEG